ncbi:STAS domain-containing protein [Hamadaea sp.]|uniref:STAS domain-containing protein n=1 Tax=Hamadaea sp. TaxID=2024425 RepID=UPI0025C3BED3|nr:STAS domain-containing protein [Hamadaea sp.]
MRMDDQDFAVERKSEPDATAVIVRGDVDLTTVAQLTEELQSATQGEQDVVIDLAGVTFIDSTGVRALVEAYRSARQAGLQLSVRGARHWVARVLEVTGVATMLSAQSR